MKNLLILIVAAALFLHFYPQPAVTAFYNETKAGLANKLSEFRNTGLQLKVDKIFTDLEPELNSFSTEEVNSLKEITSSSNNTRIFYQDYCINNQRDLVFHTQNQTKVCKAINKYASLM